MSTPLIAVQKGSEQHDAALNVPSQDSGKCAESCFCSSGFKTVRRSRAQRWERHVRRRRCEPLVEHIVGCNWCGAQRCLGPYVNTRDRWAPWGRDDGNYARARVACRPLFFFCRLCLGNGCRSSFVGFTDQCKPLSHVSQVLISVVVDIQLLLTNSCMVSTGSTFWN